MTREEVWAVYERGARARNHEFVVMTLETCIPTAVDPSAGTERVEVMQPGR